MIDRQPTKEQFDAYQAMFRHFNRALFEGALPAVMLNFSRRRFVCGFFAPDRWADRRKRTHEIVLNPDVIVGGSGRGARDVAGTLVHEMVHLWQQEHGKPGRRGYHNQEWARKMMSVGLMPSRTGRPGGERTGERISHYILSDGAFVDAWEALPEKHLLRWRGTWPMEPNRAKVRYTCPGCAINVWGKPELVIACVACNGKILVPFLAHEGHRR